MINVAVISAQSTVAVPDLSGLTPSQALTALTNAELTVGTVSTTTAGATSGNNGTIATQNVSAGTLIERYTNVGYTVYSYSAPPPTEPPPPTPQIWIQTCYNGTAGVTQLDPAYWDCSSASQYITSQGYTVMGCYSSTTNPGLPSCTTPTPTVTCGSQYGTVTGGTYSGACPDGSCSGCTSYTEYWYKCSDGSTGSTKYYLGVNCSTPAPTTTSAPETTSAPTTTAAPSCTPGFFDFSGQGCCGYTVASDCSYTMTGSCC